MSDFFLGLLILFARIATANLVSFSLWGLNHLGSGNGYDFAAHQVYFLSTVAGIIWDIAADDDNLR